MEIKWPFILAVFIVVICMLGGILAPAIYPMNYEQIKIVRYTAFKNDRSFLVKATPPSPEHPFGTNHVGQDLLALVLWGIRPTLVIACLSTLVIVVTGAILGAVSGYVGGRVDSIVMGFSDIIQPFNNLAMYMFLLYMLPLKLITVVLVLVMTNWVPVARVVRGRVMELREAEFVNAAVSIGGEEIYIAVRHIAPNIVPLTLSMAADVFGETLLITSSLSFLGVNYFTTLSPLDLGQLVAVGYRYLSIYWWESILPGVVLTLVILSSNILGMQLERSIK